MKIAFVTGCLEPGRDGVGDYTRSLAEECVRRGHAACLLSLAESEIPAESRKSDAALPELRLTRTNWRTDGGRAARRWLDGFAPDWASLQFVPYSFDPRGFFQASLAPLEHTLGGAWRRHLFFHEIWIAAQRGASWKGRAIGAWQRRVIARMLRRLGPACVHTSTSYYRAALATLRQPAGLLRMFGSVPPAMTVPCAREAAWPNVGPSTTVCGHFGTLHPSWEPDAFLADFVELANAQGRPAAFVTAGALGYGAARFAQIAAKWRDRIGMVELGRLEKPELATAFARFDFAVTTVPWNILGKSSSAAALREHGLRVVVTHEGEPPRFAAQLMDDAGADAGFVPYFRDRTKLSQALEKTTPRPGVAVTAERFLADLHAHI